MRLKGKHFEDWKAAFLSSHPNTSNNDVDDGLFSNFCVCLRLAWPWTSGLGFRIESIRGHQCHRRLSNLSLFHRFIDFRFFFLLRFILDLHIDISFFSISYSSQAIFSNYFHLNWANFFSRQFRRILISRENPLSKQVYTLVLVGINPIKKRRMTGSGNKWRQLWFIYTSIGLLQLLTQIVSVSNLMWYVILSFTDDFN